MRPVKQMLIHGIRGLTRIRNSIAAVYRTDAAADVRAQVAYLSAAYQHSYPLIIVIVLEPAARMQKDRACSSCADALDAPARGASTGSLCCVYGSDTH